MPNHNPLEGKCVLVTRAREQADELGAKLRALGATPIIYPLIAIAPPSDFMLLDRAVKNVMQYDWVVFSSANGVKYFWQRLDDCTMRLPRIAAVGQKTAQALRQNGLRVDAVPNEYLASHIAHALGDVRGQKILLVRPEVAPGELAKLLREHEAQVDEAVAYRSVPVRQPEPLSLDAVDAITLASASAATNLASHVPAHTIPTRVCIACIGPSTAKAARDATLRVDIVAPVHTLDGLVLALADYFNQVEVTR